MLCNRSLLPMVAVAFALSGSLVARAGVVAPDEAHAKAESGGHATSDSIRHSVNRATVATERASKRAVTATSLGIHTAAEATKRGLDHASKAVERAAEKTKEILSAKHSDR